MLSRLFTAFFIALTSALLLAPSAPVQGQAPPDVPPVPAGEEVLARGPVHEAYAEPTVTVSPATPVVVKEPPAPIEELPPDQRPAGDNVVWMPGYWNWDSATNEFIWLSGFWRAEPPGRAWTPGHWQRVAGGWQRVAGFWAAPGVVETEYLPPPPASIDSGPAVPPPAATATYVPGLWVFQTNRYLWRPGYWVTYRAGWVWTPSFYRWTPAGYIYVPGFWDVPLLDRGLLFAPVRFTRVVAATYVYRPTFVIQPDFLLGALFVRTGGARFYFGNYFDPSYSTTYVSWINYHPVRGAVFDVNFNYYRATYSRYPEWERNLRTLYVGRSQGTIARPPISLVQQNTVINNIRINKTGSVVVHKQVNINRLQNVTVLQPISKVHNVQVTAMASLASSKPGFVATAPVHRELKIERLEKTHIAEERRAVERSRAIARERSAAEAKVIPRGGRVGPPTTSVKVKVELPRGTPPPRPARTPARTPPPAPARPKVEPRSNPERRG